MLARILRPAKKNKCVCPPPKKDIRKKHGHKPYYVVQSPKNLPLPITITHYNSRKPIHDDEKTNTKLQDTSKKAKRTRFLEEYNDSYEPNYHPKKRPRSLTIWPKFNQQEYGYPWDSVKPKSAKSLSLKSIEKSFKDNTERSIPYYYQYIEPKKVKEQSLKSIPYYYKYSNEAKKNKELSDAIPYYKQGKPDKFVSNKDDLSLDEYQRLFHRNTTPSYYEPDTSSLSDWYQKRKTRKQMKTLYAKEKKEEKQDKKKREKARKKIEEELISKLKESTAKVNKKGKKDIPYQTIHETRHVSVKKKRLRTDDYEQRFVNCCYRICCQFYCCLTCIIICSFFVIFII